MESTHLLNEGRLADAWAELQAHAASGTALEPDAHRLAFADPEFLLRRETRGIRFQLEMLKPDLAQQAMGIDNTIVVFGSARFRDADTAQSLLAQAAERNDPAQLAQAQRVVDNVHWYDKAREFGRIVSRYSLAQPASERLYICTGGGPGIMEAANRGAHDVGALSVGLSIALPHEQAGNPYVTPELSFKFHYFALRKMHFMMRAKALVAFPGGFGTLDELFEVITLVQTQKAKPVPIILFGSDYWQRLMNFEALVEAGTIGARDLDLLAYVDDPNAAWESVRSFYQLGA